MGVDNSGVLFIGKEIRTLDKAKPFLQDDTRWDDPEGFWNKNLGCDWQRLSAYGGAAEFLGFGLMRPRSYSWCAETPDALIAQIQDRRARFKDIFGIEPDIICLNYQW